MNDIKVFVTVGADFCLLLRGNEKKLMSFEEVVSAIEPFLYYKGEFGNSYHIGKKTHVLVTNGAAPQNFAQVCEAFADFLFPQTIPA